MTAKVKIVPVKELTTKNLTAKHYVNLQWGWTLDEHIRGPFKTREAALKDAKELGAEYIMLGHIIYPKPEDCFGLSISTAISDANDVAMSSAFEEGEEPFFKVKKMDKKKAQEELDKFVTKWAKKWITPIRKIFVFVEEVDVRDKSR